LPAAALADFEHLLAPSSYPTGMVLFTETQPASGIYVVLEGEVKLSINSATAAA
jgi:CRP-like cAMP-binding protein